MDIQAALYFKDVGHSCDPEALALGLYQEFLRLGGRFQQQNVVAIRPHSVGVEVKSCGSSLRYSKLVLAAGAWSHTLLAPLGYRIPLEAERGYHLMIEQHNLLSRPVASADRSFIMTPMAGGLRLAGTVEFAGLDAEKNERRAKGLLPHAKALLKGIKKSNDEIDEHSTWMGCRPSLPDSLPVIGPASKHKNLYLAFGHQHLGLTQGAITAKLITQLIAGHTPELDLRPYSISRFEK